MGSTRPVLGFRARIMLSLLVVVVLLEGGFLVGIELTLRRELPATLAAELDDASDAFASRLRVSAERLSTEAKLAAEEPRVKAAIGTDGVDAATLSDVAADVRRTTRWDLAGFLGPGGEVLALDGVAAPRLMPLAGGYWRDGDVVYRLSRAPIAFGDQVVATLIAGERLTDERMLEATRGSRAAVLVVAAGTIAASSLESRRLSPVELAPLVAASAPSVMVRGEELLVRSLELDQPLGLRAAVIRSADEVYAPYRRLRTTVFALGAGGFVLAVLVGLLASIDLSRPVAFLAEQAQSSEDRASRALADLTRLIEHVPDSIAVHAGGRFVYANRALTRMLGKDSVDELIGDEVTLAVHADDRASFLALGANGSSGPSEIRFTRPGGGIVATEVAALPVEFSGIHAVLAVAHDLTERKALEARLIAEQATRRDLDLARSLQRALVPSDDLVERGTVELAGYFQPAEECGGDWWTYSDLSGGRILIVIGDVTGHGMPAAMLTVAAKAASDAARVVYRDLTCTKLLEVMNEAICDTARGHLHMSCYASIIDPSKRTITCANAGHDFPYLVRQGAAGVELLTLAARGNRLGDLHASRFDSFTAPLQAGDRVVWYTDGMLEGENGQHEQLGAKRFRSLIRGSAHLDAASMRRSIVDGAARHVAGGARRDDATLVVGKVLG